MIKIYELEGCKIKVDFKPKLIRLYSNSELWRFLHRDTNLKLNRLIQFIKQEYEAKFNCSLKISNDSLITEIIVHIYCHYIGLKIKRFINIKLLKHLIISMLKRVEIIDCGEKNIDNNRWLWDYLSKYKTSFIKILPLSKLLS